MGLLRYWRLSVDSAVEDTTRQSECSPRRSRDSRETRGI